MKKFLAFPLTRLILILVPFILLLVALTPLMSYVHSQLIPETTSFIVLLAMTALVERYCAGVSLSEIGFSKTDALPDTLKGFLLGGAIFCGVIVILFAAHAYSATFSSWSRLAPSLLLFLVVALAEELLFRGILFRLIEAMTGTWIALVISALLFGLIHISNPGATAYSSAAIALEAGVLLALAFALTRSLWFAIGIHWAWNFFEGPVFGTQVSGNAEKATLLHATMQGPSWLTGGAFGPEAGVPAIVICVLAMIPIAILTIRRGHIVPPSWRRVATQTHANPA